MMGEIMLYKILVAGILLCGGLALAADLSPARAGDDTKPKETERVRKSKEEWQRELSAEQYQVTRCSATERPFTGKYWDHHEQGVYLCVGCKSELFASDTKFDSGSGWPSYFQPVDKAAVTEIKDISLGMVRTEIVCSRCEAHLGHVFRDGPRPTGLRYCINSAALDFRPSGEQSPPQEAAGQ